MKIFKYKRFWLILLICLTMVGVGAGYTMGSGYTSDFTCDGKKNGVYFMEVEYLGPDASSIVVKCKNDVVDTFYDVETGDTLSLSGEGLKDDKLSADTRFYITINGDDVEVKIHTSCSKPLAVGMVFDEDHPYLEVVSLYACGGECEEPPCPSCHKPDLVISDKWEEWTCDTQYKVHFVVTNQGEGTAQAGHDASLYIDGVEQGEHVEVPVELTPGESWEGSFSTPVVISGNQDTVKVCADDYNEVEESNEGNNCKTNTITSEPPPDKPDLIISNKWEEWTCDTKYEVHFIVRNQGGASASAGHDVSLYIDGVERSEHVEVPVELAPGGSWGTNFNTPVLISGSQDTVKVCADNYDEVEEANEINNCRTNTVTQEQPPECPCPPCCPTPDTSCCDKLQKRIKELECKILELEYVQSDLEAEITRVSIETEQRVTQLEFQIELVRTEAEQERRLLQQQIDNLSADMYQQIRMLEIKISEVERRMNQEISRLENKIDDVKQQAEWKISGIEQKINRLETEASRTAVRMTQVERDMSKLGSKVSALERENQRLWRQISTLEQKISRLQRELDRLRQ